MPRVEGLPARGLCDGPLGRNAKPGLSLDEARRALYIDFEGRTDKAPILLGCAHRTGRGPRPWVWQAVTDPLFEPLTLADDEIEFLPLSQAVERILQRAEAHDRLIVAWSQHELDVVEEHCPEKLARFASRFRNARTLAVRWRNACHGGHKPATNTLADYLELIGYEVAEGAGPGRTGRTIGIIAKALEKGRGLDGLTANQLHRWRQLRQHNLHDCHGMKQVCVIAASELAARSDRRSVSRLTRSLPTPIGEGTFAGHPI